MARQPNSIESNLYYCISYYQVYIAIIKSLLTKKNDNVLILSDAIPDVCNLQNKIDKNNIFSKTYILYEKDFVTSCRSNFRREYNKHSKFIKFFIGKFLWIKSQIKIINFAKKSLNIDLSNFDNIYVFGEGRSFAPYLHNTGRKFILVEDAINYFQHRKSDDLIEINRMKKPRKFYFVNKILDYIGIYYYMGGYSSSIKMIEVNDKNNLVFSRCAAKKIIELNRNDLVNKLTLDEKNLIFKTFMDAYDFNICSTSSCIVFTNPLVFDKLLENEHQAQMIYTNLIRKYCTQDNIYIKPHPRDIVDYSKIKIEGKNIILINPFIPSEVFSLNRKFRFDKALAFSSTAIDQASFADERINLGMSEFKKMKQEIL